MTDIVCIVTVYWGQLMVLLTVIIDGIGIDYYGPVDIDLIIRLLKDSQLQWLGPIDPVICWCVDPVIVIDYYCGIVIIIIIIDYCIII